MIHLKNLSSLVTYPGGPWDLTLPPIPDAARSSKVVRFQWQNDPTTQHCFYSGWEGINAGRRICKPKGEDEGNPPHILHGLVVDFDSKLTEDEVNGGLGRLIPNVPTHYERSMSGKCHFVWQFSRPIVISGFELAEAFLQVAADQLRLVGALPGFDKAFFNPAIYYTSTPENFRLPTEPLSPALVTGWLIEASKRVKWSNEAVVIPLDKVREELLRSHPKFANSEWANETFQVDAQGPTWWVEGASAPKSAIVKESGMFTFSQHAQKSFYSWSDLLGKAWVDAYRAEDLGRKAEGLYFDGREFWRRLTRGAWKNFSRDDARSFLRVDRHANPRTEKGDHCSELDMLYQFIQEHQSIEGAAPFVFRPHGQIWVDGNPFLNTSTRSVLAAAPSDHPDTAWGPKGGFPNLSRMLGPPTRELSSVEDRAWFFRGKNEELDAWLCWFWHFYTSAAALQLSSGHNMFIAGPRAFGKTYLSQNVVGTAMGGYANAERYLVGQDTFGSNLFGFAYWAVDDQTAAVTDVSIRYWSEMLKKMASNKVHEYHEKFRTKTSVRWEGRIGVTCNLDSESTRILPVLDHSNRDKICLHRTMDEPPFAFPRPAEMAVILERELPFFLGYLSRWTVPSERVLYRPDGTVDYRFGGFIPWQDDFLLEAASQSSPASTFWEIVQDWKGEHFRVENEGKATDQRVLEWRGSAWQLKKAMCASSPSMQDALRNVTHETIGRRLSLLASRGGYGIEIAQEEDSRSSAGLVPIESEDAPHKVRIWIIRA